MVCLVYGGVSTWDSQRSWLPPSLQHHQGHHAYFPHGTSLLGRSAKAEPSDAELPRYDQLPSSAPITQFHTAEFSSYNALLFSLLHDLNVLVYILIIFIPA